MIETGLGKLECFKGEDGEYWYLKDGLRVSGEEVTNETVRRALNGDKQAIKFLSESFSECLRPRAKVAFLEENLKIEIDS